MRLWLGEYDFSDAVYHVRHILGGGVALANVIAPAYGSEANPEEVIKRRMIRLSLDRPAKNEHIRLLKKKGST